MKYNRMEGRGIGVGRSEGVKKSEPVVHSRQTWLAHDRLKLCSRTCQCCTTACQLNLVLEIFLRLNHCPPQKRKETGVSPTVCPTTDRVLLCGAGGTKSTTKATALRNIRGRRAVLLPLKIDWSRCAGVFGFGVGRGASREITCTKA